MKDECRDMLAKVAEYSQRYVDHDGNVIFGEYAGGANVIMDMLELKEFRNVKYCNLNWQGSCHVENIMMR